MKATGITRPVDEAGRVVLPKELRRVMNLKPADRLEIFTDNGYIMLKKYETSCILCGSSDDVIEVDSKYICRDCAEKIVKTLSVE